MITKIHKWYLQRKLNRLEEKISKCEITIEYYRALFLANKLISEWHLNCYSNIHMNIKPPNAKEILKALKFN